MTRPTMLPNVFWGMVMVVSALAACRQVDERPRSDSPSGGDGPLAFLECDSGRVVSETSREEVASWASGLTYQRVDSTRAYIRGVPSSSTTPRIEAAGDARRRPRTVLRRGCIIGRIVSTAADTGLGVASGANYVWADSGSGGWRAVIIPETRGAALRSFRMLIHEHSAPGDVSLTIRTPCVECEMAGWCRWPSDTIRAPI